MAKANHVEIPYLDPNVQHVGISRLRALNVTQLRELDKTLVIQDVDEPLAVLLKYEHFLAMQDRKPIHYAILRIGGEVDFLVCPSRDVAFVTSELQGRVVGEGASRKEAEADARKAGSWPKK